MGLHKEKFVEAAENASKRDVELGLELSQHDRTFRKQDFLPVRLNGPHYIPSLQYTVAA